MTKNSVNKDQIMISPLWDNLKFHYNRGKGHILRYALDRFRWYYYPGWHKITDYPEHIDLELSSSCNMKCPMCYTTTDKFKKSVSRKVMNFDIYKKILDEIGGGKVFSIRLSLRGEPTLHKDYIEVMKYAKKVGIKEVSSLTNALKLDEKMMIDMIQAPLDWLTISVDGIGETYNTIRKPAKFEDLIAKLKKFKELKKKYKSEKPAIKIQTVWPAIQDDPQAYYDAYNGLADQIASNQLVDYLDLDTDIKYKEGFECPAIYQRLIVGSDGTVLFCHNDIYNEHPIGNVYQNSIHELWHGEGMKKIREAHIRHTAVKEYNACRNCYLPREMEEVEVMKIGNKYVKVDKYSGRVQKVGS